MQSVRERSRIRLRMTDKLNYSNKELEINDWILNANEFEWVFTVFTKDEILNDIVKTLPIHGGVNVEEQKIKSIKLVVEYNE
jgi:hypothetical protein